MAQVLVHYAELGLKGKNRRRFEEALRRQLRGALGADKVLREHGRLVVELSDWSQDKAELLARLPGVRWFARTEPAPLDIDAMGEVAIALIREEWGEDVAGKRFRVLARRSDKRAPIKTIEIHEKLGGLLRRRLNLVVNLDEPEIVVGVEIARPDRADIFVRRWEGIGGLPVGTSGRGVVLFSGGLDSPVAAYWMLKRGMALELVHFYNSAIARDFGKIERLSALLSRYGGMIRLHLVDLEAFQRHAIAHVPADWRMVIYKRQMLRVAERIARNA
ncbi:MAG: tRNA 4-thiouridine(8) synthase ThiI, partial [Zetaproteobacteria bacterium]